MVFLKEQMAEVVSASLPCRHGHAAGTIAVLGRKVSSYRSHFRQSPASYRTKALLQESTAFQNNRDGANGSSGRKLSRPARRREKRHPRPWHDADSTQSRIRLQTCSMGGRGQAFACANLLSHHMALCDGRPMVSRLAEGCLHRCILAEAHKIRSATRILGIGQRAG